MQATMGITLVLVVLVIFVFLRNGSGHHHSRPWRCRFRSWARSR